MRKKWLSILLSVSLVFCNTPVNADPLSNAESEKIAESALSVDNGLDAEKESDVLTDPDASISVPITDEYANDTPETKETSSDKNDDDISTENEISGKEDDSTEKESTLPIQKDSNVEPESFPSSPDESFVSDKVTILSAEDEIGNTSNAVDAIDDLSLFPECGSAEEAGALLREKMKNREETIYFSYPTTETISDSFFYDVMDFAFQHTGQPTEGDYLKFQFDECSADVTNNSEGYLFTCHMSYYTTSEQEKAVDLAIEELTHDLNLEGKTDYEKISTLYQYICTNVKYDYTNKDNDENTLKYTAYSALINNTSICQGYAVLLYRLLLEYSIDCRVITGISHGESHAWNIVNLDDAYYNLDSTWDSENASYKYFLKCDETFTDHTRNDYYNTAEFQNKYPIASNDYAPIENETWENYASSSFSGGDGSESSPYLISTPEELARLAKLVNNQIGNYNTCHYELVDNIDLGEHEWRPIGADSLSCENESIAFEGTFDGNNCSISGMRITKETAAAYYGLFGVLHGYARNIDLNSINIDFTSNYSQSWTGNVFAGITHIGGIAGEFLGQATNCHVDGNITVKTTDSSAQLGGLFGYTAPPITIDKCSVSADLSAESAKSVDVGGLIGYAACDDQGNQNIIRRSSFYGELRATNDGHTGDDKYEEEGVHLGNASGGLLGYLDVGINYIEDCFAQAEMYTTSNVISITAGIVGHFNPSDSGKLSFKNTICISEQYRKDSIRRQSSFTQFYDVDCDDSDLYFDNCGYFAHDTFYLFENSIDPVPLALEQFTMCELFIERLNFSDDFWNIDNSHYPTLRGDKTILFPPDFEHTASAWQKDETGNILYTCSLCNKKYINPSDLSYQQICSACEHDHLSEHTFEHLDSESHYMTCNICHHGMPELHSWDSGIITKQPTCTASGEKFFTCGVCRSTKKETLKPIAHTWNSWVRVSKATVFSAEKQSHTCKICKKQETRTVGKSLTPTITLNYTSLPLKTGQATTAVKVSGLASGDSVKSWTSSNTRIAKVDSKGKITAQKTTGKATITVTLASKKTAKIYVTVQKSSVQNTKLTGLKSSISLKKGAKLTLQPVRNPITSLNKITYTSSNRRIVTVTGSGVLQAKASGTAKITVKCGKAAFYVTVRVPRVETTAISNIKTTLTLKRKARYTLKPKLTPANTDDAVTYSSSNSKIASVSSKGVIKGIKAGKAVITVKSGKKSVKCSVTVK